MQKLGSVIGVYHRVDFKSPLNEKGRNDRGSPTEEDGTKRILICFS